MKTRMIFVGPPGAGKGSQAKIIAKKLDIPHISTGDMFRKQISLGTKLGLEAKTLMDQGLLVPDSITNNIVKERFNEADVKKGFILDGYPRNPNQALYLDGLLNELKLPIDIVVNIKSDDDVIIRRITGRYTCPTCGAIYHMETNPPKVDHLCDNDGTPLVQRKDDTKETVIKRLAIYKKETYPLINYYQDKGLLVDVDGNGEINDVAELIFKILED